MEWSSEVFVLTFRYTVRQYDFIGMEQQHAAAESVAPCPQVQPGTRLSTCPTCVHTHAHTHTPPVYGQLATHINMVRKYTLMQTRVAPKASSYFPLWFIRIKAY